MPFLLANWKILTVGIIVLITGAVIGLQRHQIVTLQKEKVSITVAYELLAAKVSEQNREILKLGELKKQADAKRLQAIKKSESIQRDAQGKINAYNGVSVDSSGTCEGEMRAIKRLLERAK